MARSSVPQRLAGFEHVLDPGEGGARSAAGHEALALERRAAASSVDGSRMSAVAAGEHRGEFAGTRRRRAAVAMPRWCEAVDRQHQRRARRRAGQASSSGAWARRSPRPGPGPCALASASRRSRFMVMPSPGRRNSQVARPRAADFATVAVRDRLEHLGDRRHRPLRQLRRRLASGRSISLAAAPAGDRGRRRPRRGRYSSRHGPGWRRSGAGSRSRRPAPCRRARRPRGRGRISAGCRSAAQRDELLDLAPGGDVGGEQGEAEIGADREVARPRCRSPAPCTCP